MPHENNSSDLLKTNWERFDALTDDEIDTSDAPPLEDEFFAKANWLKPGEFSPGEAIKRA